MAPKNTAAKEIAKWREDNWPPKTLRQYQNLPIYYGSHDDVAAFYEKLTGMPHVLNHLADKQGYKPRWLQMPAVEFGVRRLNMVSTTGKTSRRFSTVAKLVEKCGSFSDAERQAMEQELADKPDHVLVAHKALQDIRVYIFTDRDRTPKRKRFMKNGLVLGVEEGFLIQDHVRQFRTKRKDAYLNPIAQNDEWAVYVRLKPATRRRKTVDAVVSENA